MRQLKYLIEQEIKSCVLSEQTPKTPKGVFKIGQFRLLDSQKERLQYLNTRTDVEFISSGSSRSAFYIDNKKKVLKLAKWQRGKAQNKTEFQAVIGCGNMKYLPKMHAKSADFSWIIVDAVRPLKSSREFESLTGVPIRAVEIGINFRSPEMQRRKDTDRTKAKYKNIYEKLAKKNSWYRGLVNMAINCGFVAGDIGKWDSWGVTKRGRVVLIDFGLTEEVWKTFYARTS